MDHANNYKNNAEKTLDLVNMGNSIECPEISVSEKGLFVGTVNGNSSKAVKEGIDLPRDVLFAEFNPLVQRLIWKYGNTPEMRKDLEGEIFCIFCDLLDVYDPQRGVPLRAYLVHQLTTSTFTVARRYWRYEQREICMELREESAIEPDPSGCWDDNILMDKVRHLLPEAIAQLPSRQRQVLIWRYYEHKEFNEIAEILNIEASTTRSLLRHAMNTLRRYFENRDLIAILGK
jgi:RNA polymerase sigma factor (sigma-70 family)